MSKIIDFINKQRNCKFNDLQFFNAKYVEKDNKLTIVFNSKNADNFTDKMYENLKEIVEKYVEKKCSVEVKVKNKNLSLDNIQETFEKMVVNSPFYFMTFDMQKSNCKMENEKFLVNIFADKSSFNEANKEQFEYEFLSLFKGYDTNLINFKYNLFEKQINDVIGIRREILEEDEVYQNVSIKPKFDKVFLGKMEIPQTVLLPENIKEEAKNVYIAGQIFDIKELKTIKKDEEKQTEKEKSYYKFVLKSEEGKIDAVCFLKQAEDLKKLEEGQKVVVFGDVDKFRNEFSIRVSGLILANFSYPEKVMKKISSNYQLIKPEQYQEKEQINFLNDDKITNEYLLNNTFVVFDLETTGLVYKTCKIIEIGAVKLEKGKITEVFSTFVNPLEPIPLEASSKNHITDDMVKDAPTFDQVVGDFCKFIDGAILVAHNISFDYPFIKYYANQCGYNIENEQQDTLIIAQKHLWQLKHFKLEKVAEFLGVSLVGAHRAVNDTVATAKVFVKLMENYENKK